MHQHPSTFFRSGRLPSILPWALLLSACAGSGAKHDKDVRWLVDHGQFDKAVRVAAEAVERRPDDARAQRLHREATVAWWIEKGRRLTFQDRDLEAQEAFRSALAIDPDSAVARDWFEKTGLKLAQTALDEGLELHAEDRIPEALEAYERALAHEPDNRGARVGREICLMILQYRAGLGSAYFKDGLHALSDYWLEVARSRFTYAEKYRLEDQRAVERKQQVQSLLAIQRVAAGRAFEAEGRYGAARGEYRAALALDPDSADAAQGIERMENEMSVARDLRSARMEIVRGRLDSATKLAEAALERTVLQKDHAKGVLDEVREGGFEVQYRDGLSLERDWRFEEAVKRYDALLAEAQFYKDAITRRDTLKEYVRHAADLYAQAAQAATPEAELEILRKIDLFWPEYRDVSKRIAELEKPDGP